MMSGRSTAGVYTLLAEMIAGLTVLLQFTAASTFEVYRSFTLPESPALGPGLRKSHAVLLDQQFTVRQDAVLECL